MRERGGPGRALLQSVHFQVISSKHSPDVPPPLPLQISLALNLTVAGPMTVPFSTSVQSDVITPWTQFFGNHLQSVTINNSQEDLPSNSVSSQPLMHGAWWMLLGLNSPVPTILHAFFGGNIGTQCSSDENWHAQIPAQCAIR